MLSLDNAFDADDIIDDWIEGLRNFLRELRDADVAIAISCEPKIDGLSCAYLRYERGRLVAGATRAATAASAKTSPPTS